MRAAGAERRGRCIAAERGGGLSRAGRRGDIGDGRTRAAGGLGEPCAGRLAAGGRVSGHGVSHAQLRQQAGGEGVARARRRKLACGLPGDRRGRYGSGYSDGVVRMLGEAVQGRRGGGVLGASLSSIRASTCSSGGLRWRNGGGCVSGRMQSARSGGSMASSKGRCRSWVTAGAPCGAEGKQRCWLWGQLRWARTGRRPGGNGVGG